MRVRGAGARAMAQSPGRIGGAVMVEDRSLGGAKESEQLEAPGNGLQSKTNAASDDNAIDFCVTLEIFVERILRSDDVIFLDGGHVSWRSESGQNGRVRHWKWWMTRSGCE